METMTFESEGLYIVAIYIWLPPASYVVFSDNSGTYLEALSVNRTCDLVNVVSGYGHYKRRYAPHYMLNHNFTPKSVWKKIGNLFLHRMRVKLLSVEKMSISTFLYYL